MTETSPESIIFVSASILAMGIDVIASPALTIQTRFYERFALARIAARDFIQFNATARLQQFSSAVVF
jgi:hypothetical protein